MLKENYKPFLLLSLLWILFALIINPIGNFPLNDDWAYAKNVFYLSEQGILKFSDWPAMTLLSQMFWASAFCKIFGFSFTVLRFSVLIVGLIASFLIFSLTKYLSNNKSLAFFATLSIILNPLFFSLSYTFMTDVPFLTTTIFTFYFLSRYISNTDKFKYFILAVIFSVITILIRQTGMIMPLAVFFAYFLISRKFNKQLINYFFWILFLTIILVVFMYWLKKSGNMASNFSSGDELFNNFSLKKLALFKYIVC